MVAERLVAAPALLVEEVQIPAFTDHDVGAAQPIIITTSIGDLGVQGVTARPGASIEDHPAGGYYLADGLPIEDAITRGAL